MFEKTIIFFRADERYSAPGRYQFPFDEQDIKEIITLDVGDDHETVQSNLETIISTIDSIESKIIYLCAAASLGFIWMLRGVLKQYFPDKDFVFLQLERHKKSPTDTKIYEIWKDFKPYDTIEGN